MKEKVNVFDYAETIAKALRPGILLNSNGDKFNSMVIGWGHLGVIWHDDTFCVYVRQSRYTKAQLDKTGEFTLSVPLDGKIDPEIVRVCGTLSGRDIDKADYVTLAEPRTNHTPGIREYPLTIECEIIYSQDQDLSKMPADVIGRYYSGIDEGVHHTMYLARIVDAYIIREDE
ncbi:MAG: flavin reductase [Erysipelotrichaceae bacterium]|nr:flavin reductase [Erysipelotrichaceae bacterium]